MASACVNNVGMSPDSAFHDFSPACPAYGWLSPRISFSRDLSDAAATDLAADGRKTGPSASSPSGNSDPEAGAMDLPDFEFHLEDPVAMLPADELFSDGKLVPLQLAAVRPQVKAIDEIRRLQGEMKPVRTTEIVRSNPCGLSRGVPKCSSRWRELLGLKKQQQSQKTELQTASSTLLSSTKLNPNPKSFPYLFQRQRPSSASSDPSLSCPLLRDSESEQPLSITGRRSLSSSSSSSSSADHDDLPRFSLDSDKLAGHASISLSRAPPRVRLSRPRSTYAEIGRTPAKRSTEVAPPIPLAATVDSPRMNACGKVVFQGLERSSSSPGSFNGGPRVKYRGMEHSNSANIRVNPVLNVIPVGSLRGSARSSLVFGFGQFFSQPKKEKESSSARLSSSRIKFEKNRESKENPLEVT